MWGEIFTAVALVMVIEGLMPFISPARYREAMATLMSQDDSKLRMIGLSSMIAGVILLTVAS